MEMKEILNHMQANIYITDVENNEILFMNQKMKKDYGFQNPEGMKCWEVFQVGKKERCEFCKIPELLKSKDPASCITWEENNTKLGRQPDLKKAHMQQAYDITEMLQLTERAARDSLCNVWNRASGKKMLEEKMEKLDSGQSCVLVLIDDDELKTVNECFGFAEEMWFFKK